MWSKLSQRLTDPLFYRKRWLQLVRPVLPPRAPRPVALAALLEKPGPVLVVIAHPDDELFASWAADLPGEKLFAEEIRIAYPVAKYPAKIASFNLDKAPEVRGELLGVKGQYLILDSGVINMRKYGGYELEWESDMAPAESATEAATALPAPSDREKVGSADQTSLF